MSLQSETSSIHEDMIFNNCLLRWLHILNSNMLWLDLVPGPLEKLELNC